MLTLSRRFHGSPLSLLRPALALGASLIALGLAPQAEAAGPAATAPADAKVKYLYKAVPCTPCPCECPDARSIPTAAPAAMPAAPPPPETVPEAPVERPRPARPTPPPSTPAQPPPPPPMPQAKGSVGGLVKLKDRSGKDKADRSDVVVFIEKIGGRFAPLKKPRSLAQREKAFVPKMIAITKGTTVDFPNEDKFFHNVFSLSEGNTFDLGLYRAGESKSVTFEKTGVVDVYCNIHPNMWAQILVLENPFYTSTAADGAFEISKLPPGSYTVSAWVSGGELVKQPVKIEPGKKVDVSFEVREGASSKQHTNKFNQPYERYK